jgi:hypothetical protein
VNYCDKCKLEVIGNRKYCPLCQSELRIDNLEEYEQNLEVFPHIPTLYEQHYMFFKILTFVSIVMVVITQTWMVVAFYSSRSHMCMGCTFYCISKKEKYS